MGFKIIKQSNAAVVFNERLYFKADKRTVVPEGHPEARYLFTVPGREISTKLVESLDIDIEVEEPKKAGRAKSRKGRAQNKEAEMQGDKDSL